MSTKTYLLKGKSVLYKISKCPKCKIDWTLKMYYVDDDISNILQEYENFNISIVRNQENDLYAKAIKCNNCDFSLEEKYILSDINRVEEAIRKNDEEILKDKELMKPKVISKTISGQNLTDDNIREIVKSLEDSI